MYSSVQVARFDLEEAVSLLGDGQYDKAAPLAISAQEIFSASSDDLDRMSHSLTVRIVPYFSSQINDLKYLSQTAEALSKTLVNGMSVLVEVDKALGGQSFSTFNDLPESKKAELLKTFYRLSPEISGLKANLDLASMHLSSVKATGLLRPFANKLDTFREQLAFGTEIATKSAVISKLIPVIAGYPEPSNFLFILQNNDELRATGGFIGTLGLVEMNLAEIKDMKTRDVYHLDMPASASLKIAPPEPIKKYLGVNYWYLRDANWSPDFPTSAEKILWFYKEEARLNLDSDIKNGPQNFAGVVAVTPRFITDLLYIVGPIEAGGQTYDKDNFVNLLQQEVEMDYRSKGISEWDRKKVIGDILAELENRLMSLPSDKYQSLAGAFLRNIEQKNILVYLTDENAQLVSTDLNWGGELKTVAGDYIMLVDSNLAAYKTDRVMEKNLSYEVNEMNDSFSSKLSLDYRHTGGFDWKTTRYRDYQRLYVPNDSWFNKVEGIDEGPDYAQDLNKLTAGAFISIEPGQSQNFSYQYSLPKDFVGRDHYSLYFQKQAGNDLNNLSLEFNFKRNITAYEGPLGMEINKGHASWQGKPETDLSFNFSFK